MNTMLNEVIDDGEKITLFDGSEWLINPGDIPTVCTWLPTAEITIKETNSSDLFNYMITNQNIGISVFASKVK